MTGLGPAADGFRPSGGSLTYSRQRRQDLGFGVWALGEHPGSAFALLRCDKPKSAKSKLIQANPTFEMRSEGTKGTEEMTGDRLEACPTFRSPVQVSPAESG